MSYRFLIKLCFRWVNLYGAPCNALGQFITPEIVFIQLHAVTELPNGFVLVQLSGCVSRRITHIPRSLLLYVGTACIVIHTSKRKQIFDLFYEQLIKRQKKTPDSLLETATSVNATRQAVSHTSLEAITEDYRDRPHPIISTATRSLRSSYERQQQERRIGVRRRPSYDGDVEPPGADQAAESGGRCRGQSVGPGRGSRQQGGGWTAGRVSAQSRTLHSRADRHGGAQSAGRDLCPLKHSRWRYTSLPLTSDTYVCMFLPCTYNIHSCLKGRDGLFIAPFWFRNCIFLHISRVTKT